MTFNSVEFVVFFAIAFVAYWRVGPRLKNPVLLVASYVFYGWWDWRFLGLLALSTLVDFAVGQRIHTENRPRRRTQLLLVSVGFNLGLLGVFKYFDFFVGSAVDLLDQLGLEANPAILSVVLPVGISFYTFQTISYSFDIYRDRIEPTRSLIDFATYVAYFPQLVAGPIERAQRLLPQITDHDRQPPDRAGKAMAAQLIVLGLVKKVVLADGVAFVANEAFGAPDDASWILLVAGVVAFAIQIYGDFSGYTDMARGISLLLGIDLVVNFTEPYLSRNITEFWRRWHISLSNWLRDYLYIPLGGNRGSNLATYRNLMITMLLGGLWHGASWNFVIWGGLHGIYLVIHKATRGARVADHRLRLGDVPAILLTNVAVFIAWIFFRATDLGDALDVLTGIFGLQGGAILLDDVATVAVFAVATIALDLWQRGSREHERLMIDLTRPSITTGATLGTMIVLLVVFSGGTPVPFIYFQF